MRGTTSTRICSVTWRYLNEAVDEGFGLDEGFGDPDYEFIRELKTNNAVFAAFKTHRQQNDLAALLIDDEGKPRSYHDFRKASEPVIGMYNVGWLMTEYTTAIRAARTASRFRRYMQDADLFPNVRWLPSRAVRSQGGAPEILQHGSCIDRPLVENALSRLPLELPMRHGEHGGPDYAYR